MQEAVDRTRTKVVILKTSRPSGSGVATSVLVRPGVVLTAGHAVARAASITAWVNGVAYPAELLARHPESDLALLRLQAPRLRLKPAELAESSAELAKGEQLVIVAGPSQPTRADGDPAGRIAIPAHFRERRTLRDANGRPGPVLALDAAIERGDSGSPVLRVKDGRVVGILSGRELPMAGGKSATAYAVPIESLYPWIDEAAPAPKPSVFYLEELLPQ